MKEIENAGGQAPATELPQDDSAIPELGTQSQLIDDSDTNHLT